MKILKVIGAILFVVVIIPAIFVGTAYFLTGILRGILFGMDLMSQ